jgi:endoglucanase
MKNFIAIMFFLVACHHHKDTAHQAPTLPTPHASGSTGNFTASQGHLYLDQNAIHLHGINWFGLENNDLKLHGIWTGRSLQSFVDQMQSLGFNAFRIPLAPETLDPSSKGSDGYASALDELKALLSYTESKNMYVLLDLHKCSKDQSAVDKPGPGVGSCSNYLEEQWTKDLSTLATLTLNYNNVVGIDLFNEPYGLTWTAWAGMSERAGAQILKINPHLLIFVEGVDKASPTGGESTFWGENLFEAANIVPNLPPEKLVYSPHVYGPSVFNQSYFDAPDFPSNMPAIWDTHFGHLFAKNFNVVVGEFGGKFDSKDKPLQEALLTYLKKKQEDNFFYWCLNPNSGDTGGLLLDDWKTVDTNKYNELLKILNP